MKKNYLVLALFFLAVAFQTLHGQGRGGRGGAPIANVPPPTSPVTGNAAAGKALYSTYGCYACHGFNGETGRAFVGRWGNLATEQGFVTFLRGRANVAPLAPSTSMPSFAESALSDKQAKDIYAYIRTFKSSAPELKDIPTLNAIVDAAKQDKK
ncbi:MAG TPA: cytochrome c [Bryobacteraceae bacterium]|jgi:mono/diheme cytochrome c family protein|nr:cytochrome c [Bryobacteraceae bacterium]